MEQNPAVNCDHLKKLVREVPDFPKKGILFYDITTLLKDKVGFATLIEFPSLDSTAVMETACPRGV